MPRLEYTWDERNRESNLTKHILATSYFDSRVCVAVCIEQDSGRIHVISLRKATREEIRKYAET